ncbi:CAP domain-containing protein [Strongyloides ratti]|uniref:CAP domain-containing protein n=1 Tax=Strongyloides ratti TaxID=34506 RepID=A0A090LA16_STRRB|nr:CAP domain-containing protein [Strongyloides ratti]CEF66582.1 CAP domain-containing protein [Strongyloides ratti]
MNLIFYYCLLIYFVIRAYDNVYLVIPYEEFKGPRLSSYLYNSLMYNEMKDLMRQVIYEFRNMPINFLLLRKMAIHFENKIIDTHKDKKLIRVSLGSKIKYFTLPATEIPVKLHPFGNKRMFECNKNFFPLFKYASICATTTMKHSKITTQYKLLGKDHFSAGIWNSVWMNCNYKCFSQFKFDVLKLRYLRELSALRKRYGGGLLAQSQDLERIALKRIKENQKLKSVSYNVIYTKNLHEVSTIVNSPFASVVINNLYNDYLKVKGKYHLEKPETKQFRFLLSPTTKSIGIGISHLSNYLYITFIFN